MNTATLERPGDTLGYNTSTGIKTEFAGSYTGNGKPSIQKQFSITDYVNSIDNGRVDILNLRESIQNSIYATEKDKQEASNMATAGSEIFKISRRLEYQAFLDILADCGIEVSNERIEVSLFQMLQDDQGNIDMAKARRLYDALLRKLEIIMSDDRELLYTPAFGLIVEALNGIFINHGRERGSRKRTPEIFDILISPDLSFKIIQEHIPGKDLLSLMESTEQVNEPKDKLGFVQKSLGAILDAAATIREKDIHGDIKPSNILVTQEGDGVLIDLASAIVATGNINPTVYSHDFNTGQLESREDANAAKGFRGSGITASLQYQTHLNMPLRSLQENVQTDSFSFTLTCLDVVDLGRPSDRKRRLESSVLTSSDAVTRQSFVSKYMMAIRVSYQYLWSFQVSESAKSMFYTAIRSLLEVGTNNETLEYEITKSPKLIPMYFYALFLCIEIDTYGRWTLNSDSLENMSKLISLATIPTKEFTEDPVNMREYARLVAKEPMSSASKRVLD